MKTRSIVLGLVLALYVMACGSSNISGPGYQPVLGNLSVNGGPAYFFNVTSAHADFDADGNPLLRIHYRDRSMQNDGSDFDQTLILVGQNGVIGERADLSAPDSTMTEIRIINPNTENEERETLMEADAVTGWIQFNAIQVADGLFAPSHATGTFSVTYTETATGETRSIENGFFNF